MSVFPLPDEIAAEFAARVGRAAATIDAPSVVAGVVRSGQVVHLATAGTSSRPVGPDSVFRIASMTKSFTAAAVLLLRDDGALRLDDPVALHVPELAGLAGPTLDSPNVTVRHLLSMASGLATDDPWGDRRLDASDDEMDTLFRHGGSFAHAPGITMEYSNYGYAVLGRVITNVSGLDFASFIGEHLLGPLGLTHTSWVPSADHDVVPGHRRRDGIVEPEDAPLGHGGFASMGGLWSSVSDLARWVGFLCDAFPPRDDRDAGPLSRPSRREMQQVHRPYSTPMLRYDDQGKLRQVGIGYGMGLQRMHHLSLGNVVTHSGGLPGYGSNMRWLPERDVGVVALANVTYAPMVELTHELLEFLDTAGALPARPALVANDTLTAAVHGLVALLNDWSDEGARALFADNIDLDEPFALRSRDAEERLAKYGRLVVERIDPLGATEADVVLVTDSTRFVLELQLAPTVPPKVQWFGIDEHARPPDAE